MTDSQTTGSPPPSCRVHQTTGLPPYSADPPASYYRVRWTDGSPDAKGREVIHTGSSCSLEAAREQRDKMEAERTAEQVWVEVVR